MEQKLVASGAENKGIKTSPFGLEKLPSAEKTDRVQDVFSSVASRYDLMNDLMSGGMHRLWKAYTHNIIDYSQVKAITDLACGSGDLLLGHAKRMRDGCQLVGIDPNNDMLVQAKHRLINAGVIPVNLICAAAESLPLEDNSQCLISVSFGLRNTTDMHRALAECYRVLRPSGRLVILEFSHPPKKSLQQLYNGYSNVIPWLGKLVTKDQSSYQYLVDSIKTHPDQPTLASYMQDAGFVLVDWINLTGGIVAVHYGYKS